MQDIHTIGVGGGGRLYGGGGGGDRRLRPHHQTLGGQSPKCPRCDSANTKFCYYNNYNLSQPRHFCKACRRYWTKGGVLRNVPVGGGCRKTKRSSSGTAKPKSATKSNKSQSSSESSSLTASAVSAAAAGAPIAAPEVASASAPKIFDFSQGGEANPMMSSSNPSFAPVTSSADVVNPSFGPMASSTEVARGADIYSGSFTSMMMSSSSAMMELSYDQQWTRQQGNNTDEAAAVITTSMPEELKIAGGFLDPMPQMDLTGRGLDHELFDQTYWNQPQWNDNEHALYLP